MTGLFADTNKLTGELYQKMKETTEILFSELEIEADIKMIFTCDTLEDITDITSTPKSEWKKLISVVLDEPRDVSYLVIVITPDENKSTYFFVMETQKYRQTMYLFK